MQKTVTINISGIIFHIEEDAFDSLSRYLSTIKGYFSSTDGGNEIMSDIEARIAELLQARINPGKQVILMTDVQHVMDVMGKPEEFGGESEKRSQESPYEDPAAGKQGKVKRRLFRNPDDKAIGGVCSGIAAYFDIDTVWIRLAMFLLLFFGGVSIWVYIILWIVMPEAKTTADKFAMRGESANVNNIYKSFQEEAEDLKNRFKNPNYGATVRSNVSSALATIFNIMGRLIGLFLIFIGGVLLLAYIASLMGISFAGSNTDITNWRSVIFASSSDYVMGVLAFIIVCGIPVLMLIYGGVKLLFRIRYSNRWLNLGLGIVWTIGLLLGLYVTIVTVKQFNESAHLKETFQLHDTGDTIVIKLNPGVKTISEMSFDNKDDIESNLHRKHGGYIFGEQNRKLSLLGYAELNVVENDGDSVEMIISRTARGLTKREANENARSIAYGYRQNKNELYFDEIFSTDEGAKFRTQEVDIRLKVPKGKVVYFDKSVKYLLDDIDNTTNTWDGDMIERRWIMTGRGLKCIDCEGLDDYSHKHEDWNHPKEHDDEITINEKGIRVHGNDTEIKIDENGIKIKTPDQDIEVDNTKPDKNKKHKY